MQRRRPSLLHFEAAVGEEFDEAGTPTAHTSHLASPIVHSPYLASPTPQQPAVIATHLQFPGFVTHVTSTMHPHPRIRPNTIAIFLFDRCRHLHMSSPPPPKEDIILALMLHLEITACVTNDRWAWASFLSQIGSHSQLVGCMNNPLAVSSLGDGRLLLK